MIIVDYFVKQKIPEGALKSGDKILHVSDTPDIALSFIKHLIRLIKPKYIIHTGDVVDNIKLEMSRTKLDLYHRGVKQFVKSTTDISSYYCLGNHDDVEILNQYINRSYLVKDKVVELGGLRLAISHYYKSLINYEADFFLFGHNMDQATDLDHRPIKLNGLEAIYVIDIETKSVYAIPYPSGTDGFRQLKFKVGL